MKLETRKIFASFAIELLVYAVLVTGYFLLVLRFFGATLFRLFQDDKKIYAAASLVLIIGQGFVLEMLTRGLLALIRGKKGGKWIS